jgi:hypothetical protein
MKFILIRLFSILPPIVIIAVFNNLGRVDEAAYLVELLIINAVTIAIFTNGQHVELVKEKRIKKSITLLYPFAIIGMLLSVILGITGYGVINSEPIEIASLCIWVFTVPIISLMEVWSRINKQEVSSHLLATRLNIIIPFILSINNMIALNDIIHIVAIINVAVVFSYKGLMKKIFFSKIHFFWRSLGKSSIINYLKM